MSLTELFLPSGTPPAAAAALCASSGEAILAVGRDGSLVGASARARAIFLAAGTPLPASLEDLFPGIVHPADFPADVMVPGVARTGGGPILLSVVRRDVRLGMRGMHLLQLSGNGRDGPGNTRSAPRGEQSPGARGDGRGPGGPPDGGTGQEPRDGATSRMLAILQHDLSQPMQAIQLSADSLRSEVSGRDAHDALDRILGGGAAIRDLFAALPGPGIASDGIPAPVVADVPLSGILGSLVLLDGHLARNAGSTFTVSPGPAVTVRTDPALLERILRNFIQNAVRHAPRGDIRMSCIPDGGSVRIEVTDNGPGIRQEDLGLIWGEGYRPAPHVPGGSGLGLSIVRRTAASLGHDVGVRGAPGGGCTFWVSVPTAVTERRRTACARTVVLVVEDEVDVRAGLEGCIARMGYETLSAGAVAEALSLMQGECSEPGFILCDHGLSGREDGISAIAAIRDAFGGHIPAALLTGNPDPEVAGAARRAGVTVISKPITARNLRQALRGMVPAPCLARFPPHGTGNMPTTGT